MSMRKLKKTNPEKYQQIYSIAKALSVYAKELGLPPKDVVNKKNINRALTKGRIYPVHISKSSTSELCLRLSGGSVKIGSVKLNKVGQGVLKIDPDGDGTILINEMDVIAEYPCNTDHLKRSNNCKTPESYNKLRDRALRIAKDSESGIKDACKKIGP